MTFVEYVILLLLFSTGLVFILAFVGQERLLRTTAGAFPLGCCLWAGCVFLVAAWPGLPKDVFGMNLKASMVLLGLISLVSLTVALRRVSLTPRSILAFCWAIFILAFLYWLFTKANISIITGDSLSHIHPHKGLESMRGGRAFNQTLAALAGMAGQDRYFFPYHSLFAVSLLVIMGECIYYEVRSAGAGIAAAFAAALAGPLLLASTHMAAIQAFYVNNHMLVATLVALALSLLLGERGTPERSRLPNAHAALGVVVMSFLCLLRLEGQLAAILLLVVMLANQGVDRSVRVRAFALFALLTAPVMLLMVILSWGSGKVAATNFLVLLTATVGLPVFFALRRPSWVGHFQEHADRYALLVLTACIAFFLYLQFDRLVYRLGWVLHNALDESHWGFVYQALALAVVVLLVLRFFFRNNGSSSDQKRTDSLLIFYLASLLLIVFLLHFHGSRLGWSDSQNRMLFHFFPAIILWVSIQAGLGFVDDGNRSSTQPVPNQHA